MIRSLICQDKEVSTPEQLKNTIAAGQRFLLFSQRVTLDILYMHTLSIGIRCVRSARLSPLSGGTNLTRRLLIFVFCVGNKVRTRCYFTWCCAQHMRAEEALIRLKDADTW